MLQRDVEVMNANGIHARPAAEIVKCAGRYRAQLLLQGNSRAPLHRLMSAWLVQLEQLPGGRAVRWSLDVDPIDLF